MIKELDSVIRLLRSKETLPEKYQDHSLLGDYRGMRECHFQPDTLLIYWINKDEQILNLERIGSHSELF